MSLYITTDQRLNIKEVWQKLRRILVNTHLITSVDEQALPNDKPVLSRPFYCYLIFYTSSIGLVRRDKLTPLPSGKIFIFGFTKEVDPSCPELSKPEQNENIMFIILRNCLPGLSLPENFKLLTANFSNREVKPLELSPNFDDGHCKPRSGRNV